jgi:O-antigen ligase
MISKTSQYSHRYFATLFVTGIVVGAVMALPVETVSFTLPRLLVFSCVALTGIWWLLRQEKLPMLDVLRQHRLGQLLAYFAVVLLLSFTWSVMPVISALGAAPRFGGALSYAVYFALALVAINLCGHTRGRDALVLSFIISNGLVAGYGFLQLIGLDPWAALWDADVMLGRAFSVAGQPNALAAFLLLTLPFIEFQACNGRVPPHGRLWFWFLIFLNVLVMMGTASRAGLIGLLINIIVFAIITRRTIRKSIGQTLSSHRGAVILLSFLCITVAIVSFQRRFSAPGETMLRSAQSRIVLWHDALAMIGERPQGYGLETVGVLSPRFRSESFPAVEPVTAVMDRAHSLPLDLLLTLGPLGLISYYALLLGLLAAAWRLRATPGAAAAGLGLLGYSAAMLVGFETVLTQSFFWLLAGLIIGTAWSVDRGQRRMTPTHGIRVLVAILGILCVISAMSSFQWLRSRSHLAQALWMEEIGESGRAYQEYAAAVRTFIYDRETIIRLTEALLRSRENVASPTPTLDAVITSGIDALERLTQKQDAVAILLRGWHAATQGNVELMRREFSEARKLMPHNVDAHRVAAHGFSLVGDSDSTDQALQRLITLLPPAWRLPLTPRGRILWKENPWLAEVRRMETALLQRRLQEVPVWEGSTDR